MRLGVGEEEWAGLAVVVVREVVVGRGAFEIRVDHDLGPPTVHADVPGCGGALHIHLPRTRTASAARSMKYAHSERSAS
jgi:hypothetical protein